MIRLKKYSEFMLISEDKSGTNYEYGCLMLYVNLPNWQKFTSQIDIKDLYEPDIERYGVETDPHATILYGIHKNIDDDEVIALFSDIKKSEFDINVEGLDCFFNKDYDVLKMNIVSDRLRELNKLATRLPHTSAFPDYKPHLTVAYLKNGRGQSYIDPNFRMKINTIDRIVYSKTNGEKIDIPLI